MEFVVVEEGGNGGGGGEEEGGGDGLGLELGIACIVKSCSVLDADQSWGLEVEGEVNS